MTPCPKCLAALSDFPPLRPGGFFVCDRCAVILRVGENWAIRPASPVEIDALRPWGRIVCLLEASMRVMAKRLRGKDPLLVKHQLEQQKRKEQNAHTQNGF